jgi:Domain of unknown function (DUF1707)
VAYGPAQAFPPQPPVPEGFGASGGFGGFGVGVAGVNPAWLASSADRERAVGVLRAGFTEGRLTQDELDDRVARAYAARTYGQLWELTSDLPAGALPYPQLPPGHGVMVAPEAAAPSHWKPAAALIITALIIFTLAALITAVITAHTQGVIYQTPGFQQANLTPFIQRVGVPPNIIHAFPATGPGG